MLAMEDPGAQYVATLLEFKGMGLTGVANDIFKDGLARCPNSGLLWECGLEEDLLEPNVAEEVGAAYAKNHAELNDMGLYSAANKVLQEGLHEHPGSPLLRHYASRLATGHSPGAAMWRLEAGRQLRIAEEQQRREAAERRRKEERVAEKYRQRRTPPALPVGPASGPTQKVAPLYSDEAEYPDPTRAPRVTKVVAAALVCGVAASQAAPCSANWFVAAFLLLHILGAILLTDYHGERGIHALCGVFGFHIGHALSEFTLYLLSWDGADSLGSWSAVVAFASGMYLNNCLMECRILPADYISSLSLFFPMFPAFNVALVLSCVEFFLEWRYVPDYKLWTPVIFLGIAMMVAGQTLISSASRTADRNYWASCRDVEEDEDGCGLEIPDRRVVQQGVYSWERHPAYLGAFLLGIGAELVLCNPAMLLVVGFVLWASLLHAAMEEEKELYEEFKQEYVNYATVTPTWIPLVGSTLDSIAFYLNAEAAAEASDDDSDEDEAEEEEDYDEEEEEEEEDDENQPDQLWRGVPRGGSLWNQQ
eukprot:CAMPEP_0195063130 /NCGR_PEP_ID=MMETSP0448-20130528/9564_1 /TAXON_ID=66468 /ORGANISM="Heterocapsa triquestra, Strain CCMP 448" /LENGTH=534 /DNA_ID=CAMNT_0040093935 /DNA_START=80 /DNA_END=1681 /DNA_ORIENTATION=+